MVERGVILAPSGGRVEVDHLFSSYEGRDGDGFGLDSSGALDGGDLGAVRELCTMALARQVSLDELEGMLLTMAVDRARGNLSSAARMLGLTRPQLAYRLKLRRTRAEAAEQRQGEAEPASGTPKLEVE
jgi:two-component system, NtrC family, response regulator HydG